MKQKELLRPFDHALADAGEPICWSHLDTEVAYIGMLANGLVAVKTSAYPLIESPGTSSLRMKPLFWKISKPVYKGDKLWHKVAKKFVTVDCLQDEIGAETQGFFVDTDGINVTAELCFWDEPKPKPKPAPLFWLEDKPVYKGDRLWHTLMNDYVVVTGLQNVPEAAEKGWFTTSNAFYAASLCKWEKPEPTPLFMLDDKPVFPGTRVWHVLENDFVTLKERASNGDFLDTNNVGRSPAFMRWEGKQKHVKFANVYSDGSGVCFGHGYDTEQIAHANRSRNTLAIARVEWETSIKA